MRAVFYVRTTTLAADEFNQTTENRVEEALAEVIDKLIRGGISTIGVSYYCDAWQCEGEHDCVDSSCAQYQLSDSEPCETRSE